MVRSLLLFSAPTYPSGPCGVSSHGTVVASLGPTNESKTELESSLI